MLKRAGQRAVAPARSSASLERGPGISFRYSFHSVQADERGAHFVAREARFEQGRLQTESLEGTIDRERYEQAIQALKGQVVQRVATLLAPIAALLGDLEDEGS